jgi:hypothetical protein
LIIHRPPKSDGQGGATTGHWSCRSLATIATAGELDLRKPEHARRLEAALAVEEMEERAVE